ncbi:hypothetical protein [Olivibacter oleidegradans]
MRKLRSKLRKKVIKPQWNRPFAILISLFIIFIIVGIIIRVIN